MIEASLLIPSDFQLLERIRLGEENALRLLYERYADDLFIKAKGVLKGKEDAEEVVQDVFVKLWNYRSSIIIHTSVKAYLSQMCRNLVFDYIKGRAQSLSFIPLESTLAKSQGENSTESLLQFQEYEARYRSAVEALPPGRKKVYQLCHIEGKSYDQVAEQLSISRNAVKDHIVKATRFLKKYVVVPEQTITILCILIS